MACDDVELLHVIKYVFSDKERDKMKNSKANFPNVYFSPSCAFLAPQIGYQAKKLAINRKALL